MPKCKLNINNKLVSHCILLKKNLPRLDCESLICNLIKNKVDTLENIKNAKDLI